MTFLAPIVGIVAGAIAIPGLLAMYFLRLRRRPVRISSTLLWMEAVQDLQVNAPFRMIRPSWLLLVQLLALLCFLIAAARPALSLGGTSGQQLILVIDRSASMSARDAGDGFANRLEEAKARATEIGVRAAASGTEVMVVSYAAAGRTVSAFTSDTARLRDAIASIEPSDQPADLVRAMRVVEPFSVDTTEDPGWVPPRIVLVTDGSLRMPDDGTLITLGQAPVELVRVGPDPEAARNNVGIVAFSARRDYEDPSVVRLFARLQSTVDRETSVGLSLLLDGEQVDSTVVRTSAAGDDGPGEATASFELRESGGGVLTLRILRDDVLDADNAASIVLRSHAARRIIVVQGPGVRGSDDGVALVEGLRTLDAGDVVEMSTGEYERRAPEAGFFERVDLIVFDRARPNALPPVPTMSFGSGLPIPGLTIERQEDITSAVAFWLRTHPVIRPADLGNILIVEPYVIARPGEGTRIDGVTLETQSLASTRGGTLILLIEQGSIRRLVFGINLRETNWWRDRSFPVVIANAVDFLTLAGEGEAGMSWRTRDPIVFRASPGATGVRVRGLGGFERDVTINPDGAAPLGLVDRAGVYRVEGAGREVQALAVNLADGVESAIATRDRLDISGRSLEATLSGELTTREVWHWFVLAGLVLLVVEWLLFSSKVRV